MSNKLLLRLLCIWVLFVVGTVVAGTASSALGFEKLAAALGIFFITIFGGVLALAVCGLVIMMWQASNEMK